MLNNFRKKIDKIDKKIAKQLYKRFKIIEKIADYKQNNNLAITNKAREEKHLSNIIKEYNADKKFKNYLIKIFKNIFSISRDFQ